MQQNCIMIWKQKRNYMFYQKKVADAKLSTKFMEWKTRPHPTLACFNDVDEEKCITRLKKFAKNHIQMPAYIASVGMLTDTKKIFASPMMNNVMY